MRSGGRTLRLGRIVNGKVVQRYVIVLDDHELTRFTLADPAGDGLVRFTRDFLTKAWQLGAKKGVKWVGTVSARDRET